MFRSSKLACKPKLRSSVGLSLKRMASRGSVATPPGFRRQHNTPREARTKHTSDDFFHAHSSMRAPLSHFREHEWISVFPVAEMQMISHVLLLDGGGGREAAGGGAPSLL